MNSVRAQITKQPLNYFKLINNMLRNMQIFAPVSQLSTAIDFAGCISDVTQRDKGRNSSFFGPSNNTMQYFIGTNKPSVTSITDGELDNRLLELVSKNKDKQIEQVILDCRIERKFINQETLKKLFRHYSMAGKPEIVTILQKYCAKVDPNLYRRNVEFLHYLAKAQCLKGNSEKGLSILKHCYGKYENRRNFYRLIFRELIHDSVLNRSEASMVIFKRYTLEFSTIWRDHYPLVCFWFACWSSSWFSDQMLSNELLESSKPLLDIVRDKATAFSITVLKEDYNEDAVLRLLQNLLKYEMITEYAKVLQILFNYKLKNKDIRGCTEIVRNCEVLGINLPSGQQGRYIKMLIDGKSQDVQETTEKPIVSKNFKLKF